MNAHPVSHPTDQTLSSYGLGKLDDGSMDAVHRHLEHCPNCRRRVAGLSADSFLGRIRAAQPTDKSTDGKSRANRSTSEAEIGTGARIAAKTLVHELADHPDYEIKRELGRGGMGVVYLAHNTLMGRDEVLKVMGRHIMERPGVLDRFHREIRAVAQLRHPNIVTAYHATRLGDSIVFAMEYVAGLDLSRVLKLQGPMPVAHACYFAYQAALGLQHAHEEGLVHRDIKPGNLMLSHRKDKATIKILDFGLARVTREEKVDVRLTSEGQALGTPDYIAPEQIVDAPKADIRADIYSLGGTLYHLLIGRPPFQADSLYDMYQAHMSQDADLLNFVRPEVPAELAALVAKMMAKDPARRFQTPGEVAQALVPFFKNADGAIKSPKPNVSRSSLSPARQPGGKTPSSPTQPATEFRGAAVVAKTAVEPAIPVPLWESLIPARKTGGPTDATPSAPPLRRPPWLWTPAAVGVLLLSLVAAWLGGVIKVKTANGVIVIENYSNDAQVYVDGERVFVSWPSGGKPAQIDVPPGEHRVKVTRGEEELLAEEVTIKSAGKKILTVRREAPRAVGSKRNEEVFSGGTSDFSPAPLAESIDLLSKIDIPRNTTRGKWERLKSSLLAVAGEYDEIQVPYEPPEEYRLEITAERVAGRNDFQVGIYFPKGQCFIVFDGWGGQISGINGVDGKLANENETTYKGSVFAEARPTHLIVTVRKNHIQVTANGEQIIDWSGDESRLTLRQLKWAPPWGRLGSHVTHPEIGRRALFLAVQYAAGYRIDRVTLTPLPDPLDRAVQARVGKAATPPAAATAQTTGDIASPPQSIVNLIGMKLVLIPAGEFLMGSTDDDGQAEADEKPRHRVRITRPFYLGVTEVTHGQFRQFVDEEGHRTEAEKDGRGGWGWNERKKTSEQNPRYTWRNPGFKQTDEHPVVNVSWNDAQAFITWLSRKEGENYRLPTEAEWEYACRAGTTTRFGFGDDAEGLAAVGNTADGTARENHSDWTRAIAGRDGYVYTAPVGRFQPNAFGLYDMHGNVWEWCSDWFGDNYYKQSPADDPRGPERATFRVLRGGCWLYDPQAAYRLFQGASWHTDPLGARSACRGRIWPVERSFSLGFRLARIAFN
jgi:formylglycine-generating enzyme required for sulfatase activity/serine/threonine protein kinase